MTDKDMRKRHINTIMIGLAGSLLLSLPAQAQPTPGIPHDPVPEASRPQPEPEPDNKEKLESARIAYFTSVMDLTPEEAGKFWPVYNEYRKAVNDARKDAREKFHRIRKMTEEGTESDAAVKKLLMEYVDACKKDDDLERIYLDEFLKILPVDKVARMYLAEEDFRVKMIKMWKKPGAEKDASAPAVKDRPNKAGKPCMPLPEENLHKPAGR